MSTEATKQEIQRLGEEPCCCVLCEECGGTGGERVYYGYAEYEDEPCDFCDGGIAHVCSRCELLRELEEVPQ